MKGKESQKKIKEDFPGLLEKNELRVSLECLDFTSLIKEKKFSNAAEYANEHLVSLENEQVPLPPSHSLLIRVILEFDL